MSQKNLIKPDARLGFGEKSYLRLLLLLLLLLR